MAFTKTYLQINSISENEKKIKIKYVFGYILNLA